MKQLHYHFIFFIFLFIFSICSAGYARVVATYNGQELEDHSDRLSESFRKDMHPHFPYETFIKDLVVYAIEPDWEKRWNEGLRLTNLDAYKNSGSYYTEEIRQFAINEIESKRPILEIWEKAKTADSSLTTETFWVMLTDEQKEAADLAEPFYLDILFNLYPSVVAVDKALERVPADTASYFAMHEKDLNYPLFVDRWTVEQLEAIDPKLLDVLTTDSLVKAILEAPQAPGREISTEVEALKRVESVRKAKLQDARTRLIIYRELPKVKFTDAEFKAGLDKYVEWYLQRKTFLPPDAF